MSSTVRNLLLSLAVTVAAAAVLSLGFVDLGREAPTTPAAEAQATETQEPTLEAQPTIVGMEPTAILPVNRIAFVGGDGNIYTIAPDGSQRRQITPGLPLGGADRFTWPTWSPDGQKLAFSAILGDPDQGTTSLFVADLSAGILKEAHRSPWGPYRFVAFQAPHYTQWASDSQSLAFLASSPGSLDLLLAQPPYTQQAQVMAEGAPLYFSWSPSSRQLLLHQAAEHYLMDPHQPDQVVVLPGQSLSYRAPAWSPDGERLAYMIRDEEEREGLFLTSPDGSRSRLFIGRGASHVYLWSPRGDLMAVANSSLEPGNPTYEGLRLLRTDDATLARAIYIEPVVAFFWAPDGQKLAVVSLDASRSSFTWYVIDVVTGETRVLARLLPSQDLLLITLPYFDQYAQSHRLWSPDSRYLVVTGALLPETNGSESLQALTSQVIILDTTGQEAPVAIASGSLAFWSHS